MPVYTGDIIFYTTELGNACNNLGENIVLKWSKLCLFRNVGYSDWNFKETKKWLGKRKVTLAYMQKYKKVEEPLYLTSTDTRTQ